MPWQGAPETSSMGRRVLLWSAEFNLYQSPMNDSDTRAALRRKLADLVTEHRDLDQVIAQLVGDAPYDQLQVQRLKKRKLMLRDQIEQIQSKLLPDIIA